MATLVSFATNFESVTVNVAFFCPCFLISCDLIGLIKTVYSIHLPEWQDHRQEQINLRSKDGR